MNSKRKILERYSCILARDFKIINECTSSEETFSNS